MTKDEAVERLLALRKLTYETNTVTRRSQNRILQQLPDYDLIEVAETLSHHQEQFGW